MRPPEGDVSMGIFVIIDAPNEDMEWALLKVRYAPEDFPADIAEEYIHLSGYDPVADRWIRLMDAPERAYSSGVDIDNKTTPGPTSLGLGYLSLWAVACR